MKKVTLNALLRAADNLRAAADKATETTDPGETVLCELDSAIAQYDRLRKDTRPKKRGL